MDKCLALKSCDKFTEEKRNCLAICRNISQNFCAVQLKENNKQIDLRCIRKIDLIFCYCVWMPVYNKKKENVSVEVDIRRRLKRTKD